MIVNFKDTESIRAWLAIAPERHRQLLRALWKIWPEFRENIEAAVR